MGTFPHIPQPLSSTGDRKRPQRGHCLTVVDLAPVQSVEILVSTSQPAAKIEFSDDGTALQLLCETVI